MRFYSKKRFLTMPIVALFISVLVLSSMATYAWFSMNRRVEEDASFGMSVKVTPNLIIADSAQNCTAVSGNYANYTEIKVTKTSRQFTPATHVYNGDTPLGLFALSSSAYVDRTTGISPSQATVATEANKHFVEYTVYIASTDIAIENAALEVSLSAPATIAEYKKATSVDFYLDSAESESNFKGTLNLAGLDAKTNNASATKSTLSLDLSDDTIPCNKDGYITLVMRCYFDGALLQTRTPKDTCFVNATTVKTEGIQFDIVIRDVSASD